MLIIEALVSRGMSVVAAGLFMSIGVWGVTLSSIIGPYASDRFGIRKVFLRTFLMVNTIGLSLQGFLLGAPLACVIVLTGIARGTIVPLLRTVTLEVEGVRPQLGGSAIGFMFTLNRFGALVWPIAMGALLDYTGLHWPPLVLLALLSFIAFGLILFVRETGTKARHSQPNS